MGTAANPKDGDRADVRAHTPYVAPLLRDDISAFRDVSRMRKNGKLTDAQFEHERIETTCDSVDVVRDVAVALLLGTDQGGKPTFGPIRSPDKTTLQTT